MNTSHDGLLSQEWMEEQGRIGPEEDYRKQKEAIARRKDKAKKNEAEMLDVLSALNISASHREEEEQQEKEYAKKIVEQAEKKLKTREEQPIDDTEIARHITLETSLASQTVSGVCPGRYHDWRPFYCYGDVKKYDEGGTTIGHWKCDKTAGKAFAYAKATGVGAGFGDDNYVATYVNLWYSYLPTTTGIVRAFVPYLTRGWGKIYANDKWYNSKEAQIDLNVSVKLYQSYWNAEVTDNAFGKHDDNINWEERIVLYRASYSNGIAVGPGKRVYAMVTVRAYVWADGSGSTGLLDFYEDDYVYFPYVRFDCA